MELPQVYRPVPRRAFEITPASTDSSHPPSPDEPSNPELLSSQSPDTAPSRTRSILNLTSSTLLGIYSPIGSDGNREEMSTPWGTGAQTPSKRRSVDDYAYKPEAPSLTWEGGATKPKPRPKRRGFRGYALRTALLFSFGIGYGSIVKHLHKTQRITPVPVPDVDRNSLYYQISWGVFGVLLGNALPLVDSFWEKTISPVISGDQTTWSSKSGRGRAPKPDGASSGPSYDTGLGPMWYSAVRSMGVFVGIAFAVVSYSSFPRVSCTLTV